MSRGATTNVNPGLKSWSSNSSLGNKLTRISSNPSNERGRRITCRLLLSIDTLLPWIFLRSGCSASPASYASELTRICRTKAPLFFALLTAMRTCFQSPCLYRDKREDVRQPSRSPRPLRNTLPTKTSRSSAGSRSGSLFTTVRGASLICCSTTIYVRPSSSRHSSLDSTRPHQGFQWSTLVSVRAPRSPRSWVRIRFLPYFEVGPL